MSDHKPYAKKLATIEDKATGEFQVRLSVMTERGKMRELELPRSVFAEPKLLERKLLSFGAVLPARGERAAFVETLIETKSPKQLVRAASTGWAKKNGYFVLQSEVIGSKSGSTIGIVRPIDREDRGWLNSEGSISAWSSTVAARATQSSVAMLCVSSAFAGPLLQLLNLESFSICLSGTTRSGKTVATLMGASVIGLGSADRLPTWNLTDAALDELLPRFNDCLAPVDDFEGIKGSDTQKYQRIRDFSYGISTGSQKRRHSSFASTTRQWRTILLTSMETSIGTLAGSVRDARKPGESVRMIDIPLFPKGANHIFDRGKKQGAKVNARWRNQWFADVTSACAQNHGAIFRKYLERLCASPEAAKKHTRKHLAWFTKKVSRTEDGGMAHDVARRLGAAYAGARLAIRYKLLPWSQNELFEAIRDCYLAARAQLPDEGVIARQGVKRLSRVLAALPLKSKVKSFGAVAGYKEPKINGWRCVLKTEEFGQLFDSQKQKELVLQWLRRKKRIIMSKPKQSSKKAGSLQSKWPDGKRRRSYEIRWSNAVMVN